ncbi:MAG: hypothetical protein A3G73_04235 [Rhodospirillales bacterium RIFCSPLOWO2_12_FULL_67_15]|nr:MAG: hypothetical protein A3G73_04235 [Rhodospirillales bacterium RIFCSPLOWO2_12_FULL_67_15]
MTRDLLFAVAAGVASALAGLAFLARAPGAILLIYLGPLPLMLVGLGLGLRAAFTAAGVGALVSGLLAGAPAALLYALGHALPSLIVVWLGLGKRAGVDILVGGPTEDDAKNGPAESPIPGSTEWYPHGHIVAWLAALAAAMVAFAALWFTSDEGFRATVAEHIEKGLAALVPMLGGTDRVQIIATMVGLFPGWIGVSWVAMGVVNAIAAEAILTRAGRALRPKPAWADLTLPDWLSWALVGAALLALIGPGDVGYTGRNLALALALPHFLLGLAVVHGLVRRTPQPRALLVGFYVVLFVSAWALLAVAAVGVLEHWIGIRNRIPGGPRPGSNAP